MIITVTLNPAVDMTYRVDALAVGGVHRVREVQERPGGKGVNVSRVLTQLGESTLAIGPGDRTFETLLTGFGVRSFFPPLLPRVRRTLVVHGNESTSLWEPGPLVYDGAQALLEELVSAHLPDASALVVSGSLAGGLSPELPARLGRLAADAGLPVVLDLDNEPLRAAAATGGGVLMPNADELGRLLGTDAFSDVAAAARGLAARTGAPVVVTLGADGLLAATGEECWWARPPKTVDGNPTGAGDATAAGVARGLAHGLSWPEILAQAVALGAAAVLTPVAGEVDLEAYRRWATQVAVETVDSLTIGA